MALKLNFGEGCGCQSAIVEWPVNFLVTFESFRHEKEVIFEKLKVTALDDLQCGQNAVIERKVASRNETSTHAIVTNLRIYGDSIVPKACETNTRDNCTIAESSNCEINRSSDMHTSCNFSGEIKEDISDNRHNCGNGDVDMPLEKVDDSVQDGTTDNQPPSSKILKSGNGELKMPTAEVDVDDEFGNSHEVTDTGEDLSKEAIGIKNSGSLQKERDYRHH